MAPKPPGSSYLHRRGTRTARRAGLIALAAATCVTTGCARNESLAGSRFTGDESLLDLVRIGNFESPRDLINAAVNQYNADERARGINSIAMRDFGADPVFVELYRSGAADADAAVRAASARALGLHGAARDAELLVPLLQDQDQLVRWQAAIGLQRLHDPAAVQPLIARLNERTEPDIQVRAAAAVALGQYAQRRVLDALIAALDDPDLAVNAGALASLTTLTGQQLGYLPRPWVEWLRAAETPFALRQPFVYPAFNRDTRWWEAINPFYTVPNEVAARPAGMPSVEQR